MQNVILAMLAIVLTSCTSYRAPEHLSSEAKNIIETESLSEQLFTFDLLWRGADGFDENYFQLSQSLLAKQGINYRYDEKSFGGVPVLEYQYNNVTKHTDAMTIIYLHGGGYKTGSALSMPSIPVLLSRLFNHTVFSIDYRTSAQAAYPAALHDVRDAYLAILAASPKQQPVLLVGDSSGGGLALALMLYAKDNQLPLPSAGVLLSPWLDLADTGDTRKTLSGDDPFLGLGWGVIDLAKAYAGDENLKHPYISPLYGDPSGLPPILLQLGTKELLLSDSIRFAQKARASSVKVELDIWDGMWHVFQAIPGLPESNKALLNIKRFAQSHTNGAANTANANP